MVRRVGLIVWAVVSLSFVLAAGAEELTLKETGKREDSLKPGWNYKAKLLSGLGFDSSHSVIGQEDGDTVKLDVNFDLGATHIAGSNEWRNTFKYLGVTSKTPSLPRYVKATDEAQLVSLYLRTMKNYPKLGPYVRASATAPLFKGELVTAAPQAYVNTSSGANLGSHTVLRVTDPFAPLTTKESVGLFWKALTKKNTKVEARIGAGASQTRGDGQLRVDDDDSTTEVELSRIKNVGQAGVELGLEWSGKWNKVSSYKLTFESLFPMTEVKADSPCAKCTDLERAQVDIKASVSTKATESLSLAYEYSASKQPDLLNEFQIRHGFKLTYEYDFLAKGGPEEKTTTN